MVASDQCNPIWIAHLEMTDKKIICVANFVKFLRIFAKILGNHLRHQTRVDAGSRLRLFADNKNISRKHYKISQEVTHLQCQEQQERLHRVVSAIDKVAHEQVISLWYIAPNFEQLFEIVELPMNITADLNKNTKEREEKNVKAADA